MVKEVESPLLIMKQMFNPMAQLNTEWLVEIQSTAKYLAMANYVWSIIGFLNAMIRSGLLYVKIQFPTEGETLEQFYSNWTLVYVLTLQMVVNFSFIFISSHLLRSIKKSDYVEIYFCYVLHAIALVPLALAFFSDASLPHLGYDNGLFLFNSANFLLPFASYVYLGIVFVMWACLKKRNGNIGIPSLTV